MICPGCKQEHSEGSPCPVFDFPSADPLIGQSLGDYKLVRELGRGIGGVVYLAEHLATGLSVAVKLAHPAEAKSEAVRRRLELEARFANQIALETVVNVFDFNVDDALGPYLVMEYLQGETLFDVANTRLPADVSLRLLAQVADTLANAHEQHILHAALKPSNIFLTVNEKREGVAKLLPFGVPMGAAVEGEEDRRVAGLGSADFRSPEQALGAPPDPRMDVYSLGAIAYLLATGRRPFTAPTPEALERAHAEVVPIAPHRVDTRVSRGWSATILRAMEKSPDRRYQTVRELAEAFRRAPISGGPVASTMILFDPALVLETHGAASTTTPVAPPPPVISGGLSDTFEFTTPVPARPPAGSATPGGGTAPVKPPPPDAAPSSPPALSAPVPTQGLVLRVSVSNEAGQALGEFTSSSVTRAGLIVCTSGPLPPLLSRVKLTFADLGGLSCDAQVVHHVTPEQAAQWKLSPGFGVQFGALSAEQRTLLETAHKGLRVQESAAERPDDPEASEVLKRFSAERAVDAYGMLAISKAAPFDAIRDRVRDAKRALDRLGERLLSSAQQRAFEEARARLDEVGKTVGEPMKRLEYDADRGNFEGVARCISAGVSVAELEQVRLRFLKNHPGIAGKSHGSIQNGQSLEAGQQMAKALEAYADALRIDPLNLIAQQRYWAVRRQLGKS